jgi:undecaprenyl-diphosphatase
MPMLIIFAAKYLFLLPTLLVIWFFWQRLVGNRRVEFSWFLGLSAVGTVLLVKLASIVWYDPRPFVVGHFVPLIDHAPDNGFPSDHAALTMFLAMVIFPYDRKLALLLTGIALVVGFARVLAGVHHIQDIFGGAVIAMVAVLMAWFVIQRFVRPKLRS